MSGSNRGLGIATLLAAILIAFGAGLFSSAIYQPVDQRSAASATAGEPSNEPLKANPALSSGTPPKINLPQSADHDPNYARQDLEAQKGMAKWTRYMGIAAIVGVILSVFGVWLIYRTWQATQQAAASAQRTYDAFINVERAFLVPNIDDVAGYENNTDAAVKSVYISVKNIGKGACIFKHIKWVWCEEIPHLDDLDLGGPPRNEIIKANEDFDVGFINGNKSMRYKENLIARIDYQSALSSHQTCWLVYEVHKGMAYSIRPDHWPKDT